MWRKQGASCLTKVSTVYSCPTSWTSRLLSYNDIPRTKDALPIIGNTFALLKDLPHFHVLLESYSKEADIIKVKAGPLDMVLLSDPDDVGHLFHSKNFVDKPEIEAINHFRQHTNLANGLAFSNGVTWERGRSIANKTLINPQIVQSFAGAMLQNAEKVVAKWKKEGNGSKTVAPDLDAYTTDTIGKIAFGEDLRAIDGHQSELAKTIDFLMKGTTDLLFVPFPYYKYVTTPYIQKMYDNGEVLKALAGSIVQKRRKMIEEAEASGKEGKDENHRINNYVSLLLTTKDENGGLLNDAEIIGNVLDIMIAGQETTSRLLAWTLLALSKEEELQERLLEEIKNNIGDTTKNMSYEVLMGKQVPLLTNTLKEVLRLYPPIATYSRNTIAEEKIGKYSIPSGVCVGVIPWAMGRSEKLWENPEVFNPDRFNKPHHPFAWIPFGAGRRNCVGQRVALLEAKVMLVKILEAFKLGRDKKGEEPKPIFRFTLCPDIPIVVNVEQR